MKLKQLLSILDGYSEVAIIDNQGLDLVRNVKEVPKDIRERTVTALYRAPSVLPYDFLIVLKVCNMKLYKVKFYTHISVFNYTLEQAKECVEYLNSTFKGCNAHMIEIKELEK